MRAALPVSESVFPHHARLQPPTCRLSRNCCILKGRLASRKANLDKKEVTIAHGPHPPPLAQAHSFVSLGPLSSWPIRSVFQRIALSLPAHRSSPFFLSFVSPSPATWCPHSFICFSDFDRLCSSSTSLSRCRIYSLCLLPRFRGLSGESPLS